MGRQLSQKWEGIDLTAPATAEPNFNQFDAVFSNRLLPAPGLSVTTGGHRYLFNRAGRADQPTYTVIWRWDEGKDDFAVPVAIIAGTGAMFSERGEGQIFDRADFKEAIRAEKAKHEANQFIWSDLNSDQKVQPEELKFYTSPDAPADSSVSISTQIFPSPEAISRAVATPRPRSMRRVFRRGI